MKNIIKTALLTTAAMLTIGSSALAADKVDAGFVTFPNPVHCQACGAQYHVVAKVGKNNELQIKLQQIRDSANPKKR